MILFFFVWFFFWYVHYLLLWFCKLFYPFHVQSLLFMLSMVVYFVCVTKELGHFPISHGWPSWLHCFSSLHYLIDQHDWKCFFHSKSNKMNQPSSTQIFWQHMKFWNLLTSHLYCFEWISNIKFIEFVVTRFGTLGWTQEHYLVFQVFINQVYWRKVSGKLSYEQEHFV